jgi:hypothetical protein
MVKPLLRGKKYLDLPRLATIAGLSGSPRLLARLVVVVWIACRMRIFRVLLYRRRHLDTDALLLRSLVLLFLEYLSALVETAETNKIRGIQAGSLLTVLPSPLNFDLLCVDF